MKVKNNMRPYGMRDRVGYLLGGAGNDFTFAFAGSFFMVFYTKVCNIDPEIVGIAFIVSKLIDAFTDIGMGRLVDRLTPGKDGRFRPWLRRMCGFVALASFLMYQSAIADWPMTIKIIYMFATYIIWGSIAYTAAVIPFGSMAAVVSDKSGHRAELSTLRSVGEVAAGLITGAVTPLVIYETDMAGNEIINGGHFTLIAGVFSAVAGICYLVCYLLTTERIKAEVVQDDTAEKMSFFQTIKFLFTNRAIVGIILAAILLLMGYQMAQNANQYVFIDYFKDKEALSVLSFGSLAPMILLAPLAVPATRKFGKKEVAAFGGVVQGLSCLLLYVIQTDSALVYIVITVIGYCGYSCFGLILWAFVTDIGDDIQVKTNQREDGTIYGVYSFARKIGQAFAGGLSGIALGMAGFDSAVAVQTQETAEGIYNVATLVPGLLYVGVGLVMIFIYPLSKKKVDANVKILQERRNQNNSL